MRRVWLLIPLAALDCRPAPHITLKLEASRDTCSTISGNPAPPASCDGMTLGCANFFELRMYQSDAATNALGNLLTSRCVAAADLGSPGDLCALESAHGGAPLLTNLAQGSTVRFRMRALNVSDPSNTCNDDLPGQPKPILVFDGFSDHVTIGDADQTAYIDLGYCGTCSNILASAMCPGALVCPMAPCDTNRVNSMGMCCPPNGPDCLTEYDSCPDGTPALPTPGGCCAVCIEPPPVSRAPSPSPPI
jgi:hypothetical protein